LLAIELKKASEVIGYCGLITGEHPGEPEIAFELLQRVWGQGYATEAGQAVIGWAAASGCRRVWATVWDWNLASRAVLTKLGFVETSRKDLDPERGTMLVTTRKL
jgi:[ribosomal protein S5]-alanine N-acetyltransferase